VNTAKLSHANTVILGGGGVMLIGSFLAFYTGFGQSINAWSSGLFGIATVVVLCAVVMAAQVAVATFASGVTLPDTLLGLSWDQVHLALGFQAAIMMIAFLVSSHEDASLGIGFWLMLLAGIALLVGAVMRVTGAKTR
jgi:hypothetical protein